MSKQKVMVNAEQQMLHLKPAWQQFLKFKVNMKGIIFNKKKGL